MSGFALNLDLSYYFDDLRKFSCIFVDVAKSKIVGDVENHIKSIFKLDDNICLTSKKFLIPRCENINILQQYEILKVQKCDFFDYQIHKSKTESSASDINQTALNLIQSERSIDLSCRPKQRLKINMCKSHCTSGAALFPFAEHDKIHNISYPSTSSSSGVTSKERSKHKKKKSLVSELGNTDANGVDILDMSLNKTELNYYKNCFTIDYEGNNSTHNNSVSYENNNEPSTQELEKKSKKRSKKKQNNANELQDFNEFFESSTCRRKKKKASKYELDAESDAEDYSSSKKLKEMADMSLAYRAFDLTPHENNVHNSTVDDLCTKHKKHKKVKENVDSKNVNDEFKHKKVKESLDNNSINGESNNMKMCVFTQNCESNTGNSSYKKKESNQRTNIELNGEISNTINEEAVEETINHPNTITEVEHTNCSESNNDQYSMTYSEFLEPNLKNKRIRRHRKRRRQRKGAVSQSMMSAVGPVLGMLDESALNVPLVHQVTSPQTGQHIYFNDGDFDDEMTIPSTPTNGTSQSQEYCSPTQSNTSRDAVNKVNTTDTLPTWKQHLLKLASAPKPVVFHRDLPDRERLDTPKTNGDTPIPAIELHVTTMLDPPKPTCFERDISKPCSVKTSTNDNNPNQSQSSLNQQENATMSEDNKCINSRENLDESSSWHDGNKKITGFSHCNGDIKCQNGTSSELDDSSNAPRKLPECLPLVPNDIQSITLTNYPIIDKVIADDLILFKVLKLNEQNQPDCSKTILAKVNSTSEFPGKISLQIIEGCEECDLLNKTVEDGESFIVQLSWTDILEPRLFYP